MGGFKVWLEWKNSYFRVFRYIHGKPRFGNNALVVPGENWDGPDEGCPPHFHSGDEVTVGNVCRLFCPPRYVCRVSRLVFRCFMCALWKLFDLFNFVGLAFSIVDKKTPKERLVQVVKWYMSAYHAGRKSGVAKKPYNPILGEIFQCYWDVPGLPSKDGQDLRNGPVPWCNQNHLTFVAEQVSHHPPSKCILFHYWTPTTVSSCLCLQFQLSTLNALQKGYAFKPTFILNRNSWAFRSECTTLDTGQSSWSTREKNTLSLFPVDMAGTAIREVDSADARAHGRSFSRSILTTPWIELGGSVTITCKKTGCFANIEFHTKPFYGGKKHRISGELFSPNDKKPFLTIAGEWNGLMEAKWTDSGVSFDLKAPLLPLNTEFHFSRKNSHLWNNNVRLLCTVLNSIIQNYLIIISYCWRKEVWGYLNFIYHFFSFSENGSVC